MRVAVTGATGFVMSVLARHWLEADPAARLVVLDASPLDAAAERYFAAVAKRLSVVVADITHVALTIEEGASFQGHSNRVNSIDKAKSAPLLALPASQPAVSTPPYGHKNGSAVSADDKGRGAAAS